MSQQAACGDIQLIALMDVSEGDVRFTLACAGGGGRWHKFSCKSDAHTHTHTHTHTQPDAHSDYCARWNKCMQAAGNSLHTHKYTHIHTHTQWSAAKGSGSLHVCSWLKGSLPPQRGGRCYSRRAKTTKLLAVWHLPWETQGERRDGRDGNLWASERRDVILPNGTNKKVQIFISICDIDAYSHRLRYKKPCRWVCGAGDVEDAWMLLSRLH